MSERIIPADRSIMAAADVEPIKFRGLVRRVGHVAGLSSWKIGFEVGLGLSLPIATSIVKEENPDAVVVYDHQKAGNDIYKTGMNFARAMKHGGVDAAILFPFTGRIVQEVWTKELQNVGIGVIVGSEMTHEGFRYSEGGRIADDRLMDIFEQAVGEGVTNFVVPGNKPEKVKEYRKFFQKELGKGNFSLYSPGFIDQGGDITAAGKAAGKSLHAIIGTGIYEAPDPHAAAIQYAQQIQEAA
jgi:orotidine-5'-phosphate decarboxylase